MFGGSIEVPYYIEWGSLIESENFGRQLPSVIFHERDIFHVVFYSNFYVSILDISMFICALSISSALSQFLQNFKTFFLIY